MHVNLILKHQTTAPKKKKKINVIILAVIYKRYDKTDVFLNDLKLNFETKVSYPNNILRFIFHVKKINK